MKPRARAVYFAQRILSDFFAAVSDAVSDYVVGIAVGLSSESGNDILLAARAEADPRLAAHERELIIRVHAEMSLASLEVLVRQIEWSERSVIDSQSSPLGIDSTTGGLEGRHPEDRFATHKTVARQRPSKEAA